MSNDQSLSINRRIAIVKGYRIDTQIITKRYILVRPDGGGEAGRATEGEAWLKLQEDWEHDLKEAMRLFEGNVKFTISCVEVLYPTFSTRWELSCDLTNENEFVPIEIEYSDAIDNLSMAVCRLWLSLNEHPSS